jgi:hypothetical protein
MALAAILKTSSLRAAAARQRARTHTDEARLQYVHQRQQALLTLVFHQFSFVAQYTGCPNVSAY